MALGRLLPLMVELCQSLGHIVPRSHSSMMLRVSWASNSGFRSRASRHSLATSLASASSLGVRPLARSGGSSSGSACASSLRVLFCFRCHGFVSAVCVPKFHFTPRLLHGQPNPPVGSVQGTDKSNNIAGHFFGVFQSHHMAGLGNCLDFCLGDGFDK